MNGNERTLWLGFEIVAEHCIIAKVIQLFWSLWNRGESEMYCV